MAGENLPTSAEPADDTAIVRVLNGETEVYADLVRRHQEALHAFVAPRCPPQVDPEEVVHQAFIKAYDLLASYQPGTSYRAWVTAIARNLLLAACKRVRQRAEGDQRAALALIAEAQERYAATAEADDDRRLVELRHCLERLAPTAQELVALRYRDGLSIEAIASRLGRSLVAIKKGLFLIRRKLHECITLRSGGRP